MVWVRCPKHKYHGVKVEWCAAASAVCHYHSGASTRLKIMERISIPGGVCTREVARAKDSKGLTKSDLHVTQKEKDDNKGRNFCGLVGRKPFKKLKE